MQIASKPSLSITKSFIFTMKLIFRCDNVKLMSEQVVKTSRNKAQHNTRLDQISHALNLRIW